MSSKGWANGGVEEFQPLQKGRDFRLPMVDISFFPKCTLAPVSKPVSTRG